MILYGLAASYHQSLMTPESVYVAISSARVEMQVGKEGRKKKRGKKKNPEHQDRAKLTTEQKKGKKKDVLREQLYRGYGEGISRGWREWYFTG